MNGSGLSRRGFLALAGVALGAPAARKGTPSGSTFLDLLRPPDRVIAYAESGPLTLRRAGDSFREGGVALEMKPRNTGSRRGLDLIVSAPESPLFRFHLRWRCEVRPGVRVLGDEWERGYGDLEWRGLAPERIMPWYFLAFDGHSTHGYGVETGAPSLCFWQLDAEGVSLWLDVRCGGSGVRLGDRRLTAATVIARAGQPGESAFRAAQAFCRTLCPKPRMPAAPVYGGNNWYYAYGANCSADLMLRDSDTIASLAPAGANRPFMVIDDGWAPFRTSGPWTHGNDRFPDMPGLAAGMKRKGVRPGIWMRPLLTRDTVPESWLIRRKGSAPKGFLLDPTVPEVRARVMADVARLAGWGYEMIKHDFSTFDLLGRWGFAMGPGVADDGWRFADDSRTTAEAALDLYRAIREAAGGSFLVGCDTFGHLTAGLVELQRIGDDTSGKDWNRTRKMGVNSLAFRASQHGAFYAADADCVGLTPQVPWDLNRQWLDLVGRSGTALFVSIDPQALGPEQRAAVRRNFERASRTQAVGEPLDWLETTTPAHWRFGDGVARYRWSGDDGPSPFAR